MALIAAHLNAEIIPVVKCSDRYIISLPPTSRPPSPILSVPTKPYKDRNISSIAIGI